MALVGGSSPSRPTIIEERYMAMDTYRVVTVKWGKDGRTTTPIPGAKWKAENLAKKDMQELQSKTNMVQYAVEKRVAK